MKQSMAARFFLFLIGVYTTNTPIGVHGTSAKQPIEGDIDRAEAIKIAQQQAKKVNIDPARYNATACETALTWRVYFEPAAEMNLNEVLEFAVMRKGGGLIGKTILSGQKNSNGSETSQPGRTIAQADALAIVRNDLHHRDVSNLQLSVCELKNFWRIIYAPRAPLDGGGPEYLINKATGRIADKRFYQ